MQVHPKTEAIWNNADKEYFRFISIVMNCDNALFQYFNNNYYYPELVYSEILLYKAIRPYMFTYKEKRVELAIIQNQLLSYASEIKTIRKQQELATFEVSMEYEKKCLDFYDEILDYRNILKLGIPTELTDHSAIDADSYMRTKDIKAQKLEDATKEEGEPVKLEEGEPDEQV